MAVERQSPLGDEGVVDDPLDVDGARRDTTYIRVARDVVHVVGRVGAYESGLEGHQPAWRLEAVQLSRGDQVSDPFGVDPLPRLEVGRGRGAQRPDVAREVARDQSASDHFVVDAPGVE